MFSPKEVARREKLGMKVRGENLGGGVAMYGPTGEDEFDWRGCDVVQWNPRMLGGLANVAGTRMFADGVLSNYDLGMSAEEIAETYEMELEPVLRIIAFANLKRLKASA